MKALLIVVSLVANLALVALFVAQPDLAPEAIARLWSHGESTNEPSAASAVAVGVRKGKPPPLWELLRSDDPKTLIAQLRAAGFPPNIVRRVVQARLAREYRARYRALENADAPYWKPQPSWSAARQMQVAALMRERGQRERELFGDPWFGREGTAPDDRRRYGNLSAAKMEQVRRIENDYDEMMDQVRAAAKNVLLDEDKAKLALLRQERDADLAETLSPDELADYRLRSSPITPELARQLGSFEPTEAEFRALVQAHEKLGAGYPDGTFGTVDGMDAVKNADVFLADLKNRLGEQRAGEYLRAIDPDFTQLARLATDAGLPTSLPADIMQQRDQFAQESRRIAEDTTMTRDEKRTALKNLADRTRVQFTNTLGAAAPQYAVVTDRWLMPVENGGSVSFPPPLTIVSGRGGAIRLSLGPQFHPLPTP